LTDAIFDHLSEVNEAAAVAPSVLRLSLDAKAAVKVGPFSRKGKNRVKTEACDHDFKPEAIVTPYGILLPELDELFLYCTTSKVTSDFMIDVLEDWWLANRARFPAVNVLLLNQDNGPDNHSRRTQYMRRIVEFAQRYQIDIQLAYYPPYHSKYNPIERSWGILENHWNGNILDTVDTVLNFAKTMTWKGRHPVVELMTKTYLTGVKLTTAGMAEVEKQVQRLKPLEVDSKEVDLGKWFINIFHKPEVRLG
jgi:Rhodopirellula transposase DDE domain